MLLCGLTDKDLRRVCRNQYENWLLTGDESRSCLHSSRTHFSARLTFDEDEYYEFMCFDAPKVVRSPGCDHGHDEESRNDRDVKIDILDDYIRVGECSNFKNIPTHTQDHGDA